ncbi:MAG TPA: ABC transporter substrate-binding protein [Pyrinomonadaceae bacterium]
MNLRVNQIKIIIFTLICAAALGLALGGRAAPQTENGLTPQEKNGKQIYVKGESKGGEIVALLGTDDPLELPAAAFTCANCHGLRGEGTKEGGLQPPPLNWEALMRPSTSALTRRERAAYTEVTLARAISLGVDPNGARLHPGMPRYVMTPEQMKDLVAYLRKLGKEADTDPGITDQKIKIGAALPLTGPLAEIGKDVKATLAASFAQINAQGGIYGRSFELVVEDSRGEPAGTLEATRRLIERDGVFAFVGSFEPGDSASVNELLKRGEVPLVGPVTLSPRPTLPPNPYIFYLLPTFNDQARSLVDFVKTKAQSGQARLGVFYSNSDFDMDALSGLRSQAKMYSMEIVAEQGYDAGRFSATSAIELLARTKPDYIFFFGGANDLNALASEMERMKFKRAPLLSSATMIGRGAFNLPESVAEQTFLSYPASLPDQDEFAEFITVMQRSRVPLRSPAFQAVAYAATRILFEATKSAGRQLDRTALISALEQIRELKTGVVPPVTFGPNRRIGSNGSYVVRVDPGNKQYVPLTGRLVPKDKP